MKKNPIMKYKTAISTHLRTVSTAITFLLLLPTLLLTVNTAFAKDLNSYCISCKGPVRVYYCKLKSLKPTENARLGTWCVNKISQNFTHNSCTITKINPDICVGRNVTYMYNPTTDKRPITNANILPGGSRKIASHKDVLNEKVKKKATRTPAKTGIKAKKTTLPDEERGAQQASLTPQRKVSKKLKKRKKARRRRKKRPVDNSFSARVEREYESTRRAIRRSRKRTIRCFESYFKHC